MLDLVFYLVLQGLFQARIKRFVQLAQRLKWRCAVSLFVLILIVEGRMQRHGPTEIKVSAVQ